MRQNKSLLAVRWRSFTQCTACIFSGITIRGILALEDVPKDSVLGPLFCQVRTSYEELAQAGASPRDVWETNVGSKDGRHVFLDMSDDMRSSYHVLFRSSAETNHPPNLGMSLDYCQLRRLFVTRLVLKTVVLCTEGVPLQCRISELNGFSVCGTENVGASKVGIGTPTAEYRRFFHFSIHLQNAE